MIIGNRVFDTDHHCYLMGILNVTPDSFSDGGSYGSVASALDRAMQMIREGADVIDVGGESTRPGYTMISPQEEIDRVVPVIEAIKKHTDTPVSIDTYKSQVAEAALSAGADLVNDIWGFRKDPRMAEVTAAYHASCCLMHNRHQAEYQEFLSDLRNDLEISVELAVQAGVSRDRILLDPGVGFGKTYEMNLQVIRHLDQLKQLGFPLLLGVSRKSVIGLTLNLPVNERLEGTLAASSIGIMNGCSFVRVHDVKAHKRLICMMEAILNA